MGDNDTIRVRLRWANGVVEETHPQPIDRNTTWIFYPAGPQGMAWFRSSDEIDDEGFVIFVKDRHGGPDADAKGVRGPSPEESRRA